MDRNRALEGRRILITGAASGMGRGIAELFAAQGAALGLLDCNPEGLGAVAVATGQLALPTDVGDAAEVETAVATAAQSLGGLDGVVNAAGIGRRFTFADTSIDTFDEVMRVNLRGPFLVARAALPWLRQAPFATIVNIASLAGVTPFPNMAAYAASKAGLIALSQAMSKELGPTIRVNSVCPGIIKTAMTARLWEREDTQAFLNTQTALGRAGTPAEIAETCLFLSSEASSFISGATLSVTGGTLV